MKKRFLAFLLAVCVAVSMLVLPASAVGSNAAVQTATALGGLTAEQAGSLGAPLTRGQAARLLTAFSAYRDTTTAQGRTGRLYSDVDSDSPYAVYIRTAVQNGWMTGYSDGSFRPDNTVTLEEACTMALRLLGYDVAKLGGTFPTAQLSKASALGLRNEINARQGETLTLEQGTMLFYNALTAMNGSGQVYASTLGFAVSNGQVDISSVLLDNVKGPFVADASTVLPFAPAAIYRNDEVTTSAALSPYDVYYYNESARTVWIYNKRAAGRVTAVSPSASAPTSVTVAGVTYAIASPSVAYQLSSLSGGGVGHAVKEVTDGKLSYEGSTGSNAKTAKIGTTDLKVSFDGGRYMPAKALNEAYANVEVLDANPFNPSLAAKPRHASFDNMLGSINYQLNKNGFNEGILSAESMIFWLDTADSKAKTPSFYISKGIEVAEGEEKPAERMFMFNPTDSLHYFVEGSAQEYTDEKYYLEGSGKSETKVIFRPAILTGVDTITTTVKGETVKVVKELNDDKSVKSTDRLDAFKFNITLAEGDDEYFVSSQRKVKEGDVYKTAYVYALNGMLGLTTNPEKAMVFTLGTEVPTANESIDAKESSIVVVAGNGVVTIQGAAGETAYVRTVLGQTVAETVLTSDNATIAAPAGVVFVTVGNETVKVAVK